METPLKTDRLSISAHVIADSIYNGSRLTTFEAKFPRFILPEFNTHRLLSRNSASSRAIPVWKRLEEVLAAPVVPLYFGKNRAGMQSTEEISEEDHDAARQNWLVGRDVSVLQAFALIGGEEQILKSASDTVRALQVCAKVRELASLYPDVVSRMRPMSAGVHKQHTNRVLETYGWHTVVVSGTRLRNFYALRASKDAQPEIRDLAIAMARAHMLSVPNELHSGDFHLPFIRQEDRDEVGDLTLLARISSARCARTSFLTHNGVRSLDEDFSMANSLQGNGHTSPFEHPAIAQDIAKKKMGLGGNFGDEWIQYRKTLPNEHDFSKLITRESLLEGMRGDLELVEFVLSLAA